MYIDLCQHLRGCHLDSIGLSASRSAEDVAVSPRRWFVELFYDPYSKQSESILFGFYNHNMLGEEEAFRKVQVLTGTWNI